MGSQEAVCGSGDGSEDVDATARLAACQVSGSMVVMMKGDPVVELMSVVQMRASLALR